jgi:plasmid stabilization system protein ParE
VSYTLRWSPTAYHSYNNVLEHLAENWIVREVERFIDRVNEVTKFIIENPQLYPYSAESNTFRCVVMKHVSLFYRLKEHQIELLLFWHNRQDPAKLQY